MNLKEIEKLSTHFIEKIAECMQEDGHTLTDVYFYKSKGGTAHVEIRATKLDEDHHLWWVCALPLPLSDNAMLPSYGILQDG